MFGLFAAIVVVTNMGYTAWFDTEARIPVLVEYDLEPNEVVIEERASNKFKADDRARGTDNAEAYSILAKFGFDRGHLAPAADFNWDKKALSETYLYSNVCPMINTVNRGEWAKIEREVRRMAESGTVHVVIYPHYDLEKDGKGWGVAIPTAFTKIAVGSGCRRVWTVENKDKRE